MALRKLYSTRKVVFNTFYPRPYPSRSFVQTTVRLEEAKAVASKVDIKPEWDRALSEAEKCVGQQTSFVGLRTLMNDEVTNWGEHMQKLEGSNHPMYNAAR